MFAINENKCLSSTIDKCLSQNRTKRIGLLVISKSGETLETLVQAITFVTNLESYNLKKTLIITEVFCNNRSRCMCSMRSTKSIVYIYIT